MMIIVIIITIRIELPRNLIKEGKLYNLHNILILSFSPSTQYSFTYYL